MLCSGCRCFNYSLTSNEITEDFNFLSCDSKGQCHPAGILPLPSEPNLIDAALQIPVELPRYILQSKNGPIQLDNFNSEV